MLHSLKKALYNNCVILGPDNTMLCRCAQRRIKWYLDKKLAQKVADDPSTIRLLFEPGGQGDADDPYMLADKTNRCVVCGSLENLTRHHIVPYCYRVHFPENVKNHCSYDILPVCVLCHERYEADAKDLKQKILDELKISESNEGVKIDANALRAIRAAKTLICYKHLIPNDRILELQERVKTFRKKADLTEDDIMSTASMEWRIVPENHVCASKKVVASQKNLDEFAKRWRCHFVTIMKPCFLPAEWNVEKKIYSMA